MKYNINGQNYNLVSNPIKEAKTREEYFTLTKNVFGLDFSIWYNSGFWGDKFVPYTLFDDDKAVASVGVSISEIEWNGHIGRYAQLSTVMTEPAYRGRGVNQWLLKLAISEWKEKSDCVYLYANDSVVDYYPKFGFKELTEYRYKKEICNKNGHIRKLDLTLKSDLELLVQRYSYSNPYSMLSMKNNPELMMFHCLTFLKNHIYYIEQYDAVVIATFDEDEILCYDIFTNKRCHMDDVLGVFVEKGKQTVVFGFTPISMEGYSIEAVREKNYHVFVLKDNEKLFECNKISLPLLSHA